MSKNKIVDYYKPNDERLPEYYLNNAKLLGLDKYLYGEDEMGTLRFETTETDTPIWKRYKELGGSIEFTGDINTLWMEYHEGKFSMDDMMQFYREIGYSLCGYVDVWAERFYQVEDAKEFQKALDQLKTITSLEKATQHVMNTLLLAHLDSVDDELVLKYRIEVKKIIDENFGEGTWKEFVTSIRNKKL